VEGILYTLGGIMIILKDLITVIDGGNFEVKCNNEDLAFGTNYDNVLNNEVKYIYTVEGVQHSPIYIVISDN
jgi:hypothetical protein